MSGTLRVNGTSNGTRRRTDYLQFLGAGSRIVIMQVWIFNPFDDIPTEGKPQRFWTLADALAAQGHSVVWWSSNFSHRRKARRSEDSVQTTAGEGSASSGSSVGGLPSRAGVNFEAPLGGHSDESAPSLSTPRSSKSVEGNHSMTQALNFRLCLIATPPYNKNISFARVRNHRAYGKNLYRDACAMVDSGELPKPDVILATLPPMEGPIAALRLRKRYGCRVVTDMMDAWPETLLQALDPSGQRTEVRGQRAGGWLKSVGRLLLSPYYRMLGRACRESDAVSAQSETFADFARQHGAKGEVHVCYLGADTPSRPLTSDSRSLRKLRLLYLGSMGRSYDLETLLTATANLLRKGHTFELHIAGEGEKLKALEGIAADAPEGAINFHGFLEETEFSELLQSSDVGVVPMMPESGVAVPYKVGDYLSAGLAVVSSLPGELDELLEEFQCGRFYEAKSVSSMEAALEHYLEQSPENLHQAKKSARALFERHFNRSKTYPKFAKWVAASGEE